MLSTWSELVYPFRLISPKPNNAPEIVFWSEDQQTTSRKAISQVSLRESKLGQRVFLGKKMVFLGQSQGGEPWIHLTERCFWPRVWWVGSLTWISPLLYRRRNHRKKRKTWLPLWSTWQEIWSDNLLWLSMWRMMLNGIYKNIKILFNLCQTK